jgi:hypothetical protein
MAALPVPYRAADLGAMSFAPMIKDTSARLYVVPIQPPLIVTTPPVTTASAFEDDLPFVYITPKGAFGDFLKKSEDAVLTACLANKKTWFATQHDDDALRRGFKTFFKDDTFKLKVPSDAGFFDAKGAPIDREDIPVGATVRCALELSRICFGRHEFGSTWKLVQAKVVETQCLIQDDAPDDDDKEEAPEPTLEPELDSDSDANEFL